MLLIHRIESVAMSIVMMVNIGILLVLLGENRKPTSW